MPFFSSIYRGARGILGENLRAQFFENGRFIFSEILRDDKDAEYEENELGYKRLEKYFPFYKIFSDFFFQI